MSDVGRFKRKTTKVLLRACAQRTTIAYERMHACRQTGT